jgi:hypothetical protein
MPYGSSTAHLMRPTDTTTQFKSIPYQLCWCHTAVQQHTLWGLQTLHCSSKAYRISSADATLQFNSIPYEAYRHHITVHKHNISSADATLQSNSIPYEAYRHHIAVLKHTISALLMPHCSSTAYLIRPPDTTLQFKSIPQALDITLQFNNIPCELYRRYTASLLQVHLPSGVQHTPDGTLLDTSHSIVNHPNDDTSDNGHHSECFLIKEDH